jgi:hypothetical protein
MPVAATAGAISLAGAIMADPILPPPPIIPAIPAAEATAVEVTVGEAAMAAAEAINGPALLYQDRDGRRIIPELF